MEKPYIAMQYWTDKTTHQIVTKFAKVTEAVSKEGREYGNVSDEIFELVEGKFGIGTLANFTTTMSPAKATSLKLTKD